MNEEILKKHGFEKSFSKNIYNYTSLEFPNMLYHVIFSDNNYFFRGLGKTISLIKNEQHLIDLKQEYNL